MKAMPTTKSQNGDLMTVHDLPKPNLKRCTPERKANIVHAVNGGLVTVDAVCAMYDLSPEEYYSWSNAIDGVGIAGLKLRQIEMARHAR